MVKSSVIIWYNYQLGLVSKKLSIGIFLLTVKYKGNKD